MRPRFIIRTEDLETIAKAERRWRRLKRRRSAEAKTLRALLDALQRVQPQTPLSLERYMDRWEQLAGMWEQRFMVAMAVMDEALGLLKEVEGTEKVRSLIRSAGGKEPTGSRGSEGDS